MESLSDDTNETEERRRVGLVYDERMCKHSTPKKEPHPENPSRIRAVWNKLMSAGIPQRCVVFKAKEVEDKYIEAVHSKSHINLIKTISSKKTISQRNKVAAKYDSIYFNEGSSESAYLAAGSMLEVAEKVAKGELNSAFAIVRPPGHHAEKSEPMGFCLFNNVAIAASFLLDQKKLGIKKILIVDWDVHHGNATQNMFWKDSRVLSFSVHRHENGSFYPGGDDGSHTMVGEGPGLGYNINVPWENAQCDEADYIAVWDHILIPVAKKFNPDIILISAGFDAATGDPLGGCCVTPHGFSLLLKKLMKFSKGKIVMALEGGYNLDSLSKSVLACIEVLLEDNPIAESYEVYPFESTWRVIKDVRGKLSKLWPVLATKLPKKLTDRVKPLPETSSSQSDVEEDCVPDTLMKKRKCQTLSVGNSLFKCKQQKVSDMNDEEDFEDPQSHTALKLKWSNAELDDDCVSALTQAFRLLCQMDKNVDVYRDGIQKLKAKSVEDSDIIERQCIAIKENVKRLQSLLNSEKEFKDKLLAERVQNDAQIRQLKDEQAKVKDKLVEIMTMNNNVVSDIVARDKTLIIKDEQIQKLKDEQANVKDKLAKIMTMNDNMVSDIVTRDKTLITKDAQIQQLKVEQAKAKDKLAKIMTMNDNMVSDIVARDKTLSIKDEQIRQLKDEQAKVKDKLAKIMTMNDNMVSNIVARDKTLIIKDAEIQQLKDELAKVVTANTNITSDMVTKKDKKRKASVMSIEVAFKYPQSHTENLNVVVSPLRVLKLNKISNAKLAGDCVLVMKEAARRLHRMDNNDDAYHECIQNLKARAVEDSGIIKKQNISIEESDKRLQRELQTKKGFKDNLVAERAHNGAQVKETKDEQDKVMTDNYHMASDIITRKTLSINFVVSPHRVSKMKKMSNAELAGDCFLVMTEAAERLRQMDNKEIEALKQQVTSLEEKNCHMASDIITKDKTLAVKDKEIEALKQQVVTLKTKDCHMASDIVTKDKTLTIKTKEIDALKQQLESLEAKDNEIQDLKQQLGYAQTTEAQLMNALRLFSSQRAEALEKTIKADHDRTLLLTEFIPNMVKDLFQRYDDTVTERLKQAVKECHNIQLSCIQEIVANADKPLEDIMEITAKKFQI